MEFYEQKCDQANWYCARLIRIVPKEEAKAFPFYLPVNQQRLALTFEEPVKIGRLFSSIDFLIAKSRVGAR